MRNLLTHEMDAALARHDNDMVNQLLDNAMANHLLGPQAPSIIRGAATQQAQRQLRAAIESGDVKRIKGSLVAAKRGLAVWSSRELEISRSSCHRAARVPRGRGQVQGARPGATYHI